jgi:hypothetical protein
MTKSLAFFVSLAALFAACRTGGAFDPSARQAIFNEVTADWSPESRAEANALVAKYGPPDAVAGGALGWSHQGDWKRIIVWNAGSSGDSRDLEQTVSYAVPPAARAKLAVLRDRVEISPDGTELTARAEDEPFNILALNLADEVARGKRAPQDARAFYDRVVELSASGKSSPYLRSLLFVPSSAP